MSATSSLKSISLRAAARVSALLLLQRAAAEVVSVAPNGFETHLSIHVAASPDQAYAAALNPAQRWTREWVAVGAMARYKKPRRMRLLIF